MLIFVNSSGQAIVALTKSSSAASFSFPELDAKLSAIVSQIRVTPKPVVSVVSTLGGKNYINVFGEDPLQLELMGTLLGANCSVGQDVTSAVATGVDFYKSNSVINRVTPIQFRLQSNSGSGVVPKAKKAFMIAMTISQDAAFPDMASFNMLLIAESFDDRELAVSDAPILPTSGETSTSSRALSSNLSASSTGALPGLAWSGSVLIDVNGEVIMPVTQTAQV